MDRKSPIDPELVARFVKVAHGDLAQVRWLLEQEPRLANATCDWGGGDWESALGATAHTGQREIACYLLERGARLDLFAAAMLGRLAIVRAIIEAFPGALTSPGPHGIPLRAHAVAGGPEAAAVVDYLDHLPA